MPCSIFADLHIHTTASDGSESFESIFARASSAGLGVIAFTNHDTLHGLAYACALQGRFDIRVIGGIEISAWDPKAETKAHILGYGFTTEDAPAIEALCTPLLERRRANTLWQIEQLEAHGYKPDLEKIERLAAHSTSLYKQHVMAALTDEPFASAAYLTLYRSLFKQGGICDRDISYVDAADAVRAIKEDGGFAVLAHPGQFDNFGLVPRLVDAGLSGIEKLHPLHGKNEERKVEQLAAEYDLFCTGGSDFHGAFGKTVLGFPRVSVESNSASSWPFL